MAIKKNFIGVNRFIFSKQVQWRWCFSINMPGKNFDQVHLVFSIWLISIRFIFSKQVQWRWCFSINMPGKKFDQVHLVFLIWLISIYWGDFRIFWDCKYVYQGSYSVFKVKTSWKIGFESPKTWTLISNHLCSSKKPRVQDDASIFFYKKKDHTKK